MIDEHDVERVAEAGESLAPVQTPYLEEDFVMNLLETVLDYQQRTNTVVNALEYFRANRWTEIRTLDDLDAALSKFHDDEQGNTALARYLWNYAFWTRAGQLRGLARYFRSIGVVDQEALKTWAHDSDFRSHFRGQVKGLGPAVYQSLVMRQGVETVKPDVHVRRFTEKAVGRRLNDDDVVDVVTRAARLLNLKANEFDWRIWEASRSSLR